MTYGIRNHGYKKFNEKNGDLCTGYHLKETEGPLLRYYRTQFDLHWRFWSPFEERIRTGRLEY